MLYKFTLFYFNYELFVLQLSIGTGQVDGHGQTDRQTADELQCLMRPYRPRGGLHNNAECGGDWSGLARPSRQHGYNVAGAKVAFNGNERFIQRRAAGWWWSVVETYTRGSQASGRRVSDDKNAASIRNTTGHHTVAMTTHP